MTEKISGSNPTAGKLIVFEGADGCGKTTQLQRIYHWLLSHSFPGGPAEVQTTKEPGSTSLGRELRDILLNPSRTNEGVEPTAELLLYAADRAQHVQKFLRPCLEKGQWVLCDRHRDSTIAYQGFGRGLDLNLIEELNHIATLGLVSDLTIWLDLPLEETQARLVKRGEADRMEQAGLEFQRRVQQGFNWLAQQHPQRIVRVDASGDMALVTERIKAVILERFHHPEPMHR